MLRSRSINKLSDEELVRKYKSGGKQKIIGELWNRYSLMVFGVCLKYMSNKEQAEDSTLLIFESLFDKLKKNDVEYFKSWLYTLSKNQCLMILRKEKKWKNRLVESDQLPQLEDENDLAFIKEQRIEALEESLEMLKEEQRVCIELFYLNNKSYNDISSLTGYDLKQVKSHIQNGKRNLKNQLDKNNEIGAE